MLQSLGKKVIQCSLIGCIVGNYLFSFSDLVYKMPPIETYVFLDLETTGFPKEELNKTKITELSLVAVKRSHILETNSGDSPRVQQKLTLCFNPGRIIQPGSSKVTGLCNFLLEYESPLNELAFNTINSFLSLLSKPICLIAHNGIAFDFPILKKHLMDLNVSLSDDLLCADCLHAFYDIETKPVSKSSDEFVKNENKLEKDTVKEEFSNNIQKQNEKTPTTSNSGSSTTVNTPRKCKISGPKGISRVRRKIYFDDNPKPQKRFRLNNIYERLLNRNPIKAHRAENDCIMALECSVVKAKEFVQWVDDNHTLFAEIKPMTIGVPIGY